jgi:lactose/L-arabinose transport system substrate-binding protein
LAVALGLALVQLMNRRGAGDHGRRAAAHAGALVPSDTGAPEQLTGRLNVWAWNIAAKSLDGIKPAFRERYSNIDVHVEMSGTIVQTRFLLALSAGTGAPDVMQLQAYEAQRFLATGRLADLTPVAAAHANDFPAASWANCTRDGRVYAIPWDVGPCAVFYKPEVFERYGVDPDGIETWDDYIAAGQHIVRASGGRTKMLALSGAELQNTYEMLLQQLGGQMFDDQGRVAVKLDASRRVMDLIRRMIDAGICADVRPWTHDWMAGFNGDTIATYPNAVWLGGTIKDTVGGYGAGKAGGGWRAFPLPAFERGGRRVSNLGGSVLVIPEQCAQKQAAWAFIEYALCTREGQLAHYANYDLFPAYLPALQDPLFEQPDPFFGGQHVRALFARRVREVPALNRTADWAQAIGYAGKTFSRWADDREDTAAMLDGLARKLGQRLDRAVAPRPGEGAPS